MENEPGLLIDLVAALGVGLAGGWLATRIGLSSIAGYVFAGIIIGSSTPGFVADVDRLRLIADIGVVLLLFGIGVQFSLRDLTRVGWPIALAAVAQVAPFPTSVFPSGGEQRGTFSPYSSLSG